MVLRHGESVLLSWAWKLLGLGRFGALEEVGVWEGLGPWKLLGSGKVWGVGVCWGLGRLGPWKLLGPGKVGALEAVGALGKLGPWKLLGGPGSCWGLGRKVLGPGSCWWECSYRPNWWLEWWLWSAQALVRRWGKTLEGRRHAGVQAAILTIVGFRWSSSEMGQPFFSWGWARGHRRPLLGLFNTIRVCLLLRLPVSLISVRTPKGQPFGKFQGRLSAKQNQDI